MIHTKLSRGGLASWFRLPALLLIAFLLNSGIFHSLNTRGQAHAARLSSSATQVVSGNHIASIAEGQIGGTCSNYYGCPFSGEWCAEFARWVWSQAGVNVSSLTAAAASFYDYGKNNGTLSNTPQVGDAVVYGYNTSIDYAQHVALVTNVDTAHHTIIDVGGNEGGGAGVVQEDGPYDWTVGGSPTGQVISGYIAPIGLENTAGGTRGSSQAVSQPDGTVDTFYESSVGALGHDYYANSSWHGPYEMPGTAPMGSEPSAVTSSLGVVDVFWKGADGDLWHVFYTKSSGWSTLQHLAYGPLGGPPEAVAAPDGTIGVFWRGTTGDIWDAWYAPGSGSGWSGPHKLTSGLHPASDPAPVTDGNGTWDVFWKGADGNLWHVFSNNNGSSWTSQNLGDGTLGGGPFATGQSDGTIDVFWKGSSPASLWHAWFYVPGWNGPQNLGGSVA